ncbi:MAG: phosphatase [Romboutsia sp.]|uniref:phosphatase n=1 Tax=Romboutsia sp. TaxID=1965302 RepID=UPI003F3E05D7
MKALIDLHTHTIVSGHAYSTVQENIQSAIKNGLKYLGLSEHAPTMPGGAHEYYFHNIYCIPSEVDGLRILRGIEANIIDFNGNTDAPDDMLTHIDYVIASLHTPCIASGTVEENTNAILNVMDKLKVKIIGHLDDSRYPVDYERIVKKAKEKNILLEINNSSLKPTTFRQGAWENLRELLNLCEEYKVKVILGSDAHISYDVGKFPYSEKIINELSFPKELVINYNEDEIISFFNI